MADITDADQVEGQELGKILKLWSFWALIVGLAVCAGVAAGFYWNPIGGLVAFAAVIVIGLICAYAYAGHLAEEAFYDAYAKSRGLKRSETQLGKLTPLLDRGNEQRTDEMFTGTLDGGFEGSLALFTYIDKHLDEDGNEQRDDHPFTVVHIEIPETRKRLPQLLTQRQSGFKALEKLEDKFRGDHERVKLESQALDERYEIFVGKDQDAVFVRQVFSPSFIVWLTEGPPKEFAFELVDGNLIAYVPKHRDATEGFDEMITVACAVATRLYDEATE